MPKTPLSILAAALLLLSAACGGVSDQPEPATPTPSPTVSTAAQPQATATGAVQSAAPAAPTATLPTTATVPPQLTTVPTQPAAAPIQPAAPTQPAASALNELETVVASFASIRSFRARLSVEVAGQAPQTGTVEFVRPDRARLSLSGGPVGAGELVFIGQDVYVNYGGIWTKLPPGTTTGTFDISALSAELGDPSSITSPQRIGTDNVNGRACQVYTSSHPVLGTSEFCVADGRLLRLVQKEGSVIITLVFEEYDGNIEIRPPL